MELSQKDRKIEELRSTFSALLKSQEANNITNRKIFRRINLIGVIFYSTIMVALILLAYLLSRPNFKNDSTLKRMDTLEGQIEVNKIIIMDNKSIIERVINIQDSLRKIKDYEK